MITERALNTPVSTNMSQEEIRQAEIEMAEALANWLSRELETVTIKIELFPTGIISYSVYLDGKNPAGLELDHVRDFFNRAGFFKVGTNEGPLS